MFAVICAWVSATPLMTKAPLPKLSASSVKLPSTCLKSDVALMLSRPWKPTKVMAALMPKPCGSAVVPMWVSFGTSSSSGS